MGNTNEIKEGTTKHASNNISNYIFTYYNDSSYSKKFERSINKSRLHLVYFYLYNDILIDNKIKSLIDDKERW